MVEKLSFNLSNCAEQEFPFPLKLINYVNQEADAEIKQKLDRCCKYFYKEAPYLIIDSLEIKKRMENEAYEGCIDFIDDDQLQNFLEKSNNIWVKKKVNVSPRHNLDIHGNNIDVQLFNKIIRSDAKEISIYNMILSFVDYKLLTKSRNVEYLNLSSSSIISGLDKSFVPLGHVFSIKDFVQLEDVLAMVPNAMVIRMFDCRITSDTMKKLLEIPWKNKVIELILNCVDGPLDANLFFKFVMKHVDPEAKFYVDSEYQTDTFQKLYSQMVIEYDDRMSTIRYDAFMAKKKTKVQHVLSWMASIASIIKIIQGDSALPFMKPSVVPKKYENITFNEDNMERQYTAFPYPHMCYIRKNADAETWKKLERTCKFFCQKNPYLIVDDVHVAADNKITLMVDNSKIMFENRQVMGQILLWITNSIDSVGTGGLYLQDRVDAIKISTGVFTYTKDHLINLTKSGKFKDWNSIDGRFKNNDYSKDISLIEFLIHLPNVEIFCAKVRGIHPCYPNKPVLLSQSNKIKYLEIILLDDPIQADPLFDVLKTSLAPKAMVKIDLSRLIEQMDVEEFKAQMKAKLDTWKPQIDKPTFKIIL